MSEIQPQHQFYEADSYRPEDSTTYMMRQILTMVAHEVERQLAHTDLTNTQWIPLFKLYMGQASTVAELARHCDMDAGAMTRKLDRMEAKGLCKRIRSETDRRVVNLELTEAGRKAASALPQILTSVQNANLAGFTEEEFQTLRSYMRRILKNAHSIANQAHDTES